MQLLFVHGWSVTNTQTYGRLPQLLVQYASEFNLEFDIQHIYLGRYISFHDEVTMDDIGRAMDRALRELPGNSDSYIAPFSCVTHSTGGPVVRYWANKYYGVKGIKDIPLRNLVMLAPANHGSSLAKLGKARVGRIKSWFSGVEPGEGVLNWLSLGSEGQWQLNKDYLNYDYMQGQFYPFVLTGQRIDDKFYDFINSYLIESGSDGVVRVAGANMNYRYISLRQSGTKMIKKRPATYQLEHDGVVHCPQPVALGVYDRYSHYGEKMGIMQSIDDTERDRPFISDILKCLQVQDYNAYLKRSEEMNALTENNQVQKDRYCMLVVNVCDDAGNTINNDDYDLFLLAGNKYQPHQLPEGFLKDRQLNDKTGNMVFYLDANKMQNIKDGKFGIRIVARPEKGFSYYAAAEFRSDGISAEDVLVPNQTVYVDVVMHRFVDQNVFRFGPVTKKPVNFKGVKPSGKTLSGTDS